MLIGVPKEIKSHEYRVGLTPMSVSELTQSNHQVMIEKNAGAGIGFSDEDYQNAGAMISDSADEIFAKADMIIKVKEPQPSECKKLRQDQILFTYLHLAPDPLQTELLVASGCSAIAYETVTANDGSLPLLTPMSQVAGRMSIQAGAHSLEKAQGGRGVLLGGVPGVSPANVVVIGGGVVGSNAIRMAVGMQANVTVLDKSLNTLHKLDMEYGSRIRTIYSTSYALETHVCQADLVIGAVLVPGAAAPKLVTKDMLAKMPNGAVVVDVAIDQGGCFETSKATTHEQPTYVVNDVVHYCVANMPGGVARTSTFALNNATLPFVLELANKGMDKALKENHHLRNGLNVHQGQVTYEAVARDLNYDYKPASELFA